MIGTVKKMKMSSSCQSNKLTRVLAALGLSVILLSACSGSAQLTALPSASQTSVMPSATPSPQPTPLKTLTVCLAEDPGGLFRYAPTGSRARESLFAAIYDGPFEADPVDGSLNPGFLEAVPTAINNGIQTMATEVSAGSIVIDAYSNQTVLKPGLLVRPAGCQSSACAVEWDGSAGFRMDQTEIRYTLRSGLLWSDGTPLTASDFQYAFQVSAALGHPGRSWEAERTAELKAESDLTVLWTSIPGFATADAAAFLWLPLPSQQLSGVAPENLAADGLAAETPLGWGAFRWLERSEGEIRLERNPYYFRLEEGLPAIDQLVFRIVPDGNAALTQLDSGGCDLLDSSYAWESLDQAGLTALSQRAELHWQDWEAVEQLVFGVWPASYDDGFSLWAGDRPDYFGEQRIRQALSACLDPRLTAERTLTGWLPQDTPLQLASWTSLPADGASILEEAGWRVPEGSVDGVRSAQGVANVPDGTPFQLELLSGLSRLDALAAGVVVERLGACGVGVSWQALPVEALYAPGPEGPLFGRNFDLALITWQSGAAPACALYGSSDIPASGNYWIGTNIAGYQDLGFDLACADLSASAAADRPDVSSSGLEQALPAVPLLPHPRVWLSRPGAGIDPGLNWDKLEIFNLD